MHGFVPGDATFPTYPITMGSPFGCENDTDGSNIATTAITTTETITPTTIAPFFIMAPPPYKKYFQPKKIYPSLRNGSSLQVLNIL
jgi:hypothetical protein